MSKHWDDVEAQIVDGDVSAKEWDRTEEQITDGEVSVEERVQFTPGPWKAQKAEADDVAGRAYRALVTAKSPASKLTVAPACGAGRTPEMAEANARLIAAAPAMHDDHRANAADAASLAEAIRDERWDDARMLAGVIARRSEGAINHTEREESTNV